MLIKTDAGVVKLVNTRDLKSLGFGLAGSSPAARTILYRKSGSLFSWLFPKLSDQK